MEGKARALEVIVREMRLTLTKVQVAEETQSRGDSRWALVFFAPTLVH